MPAYKSDRTPRLQARDAAIELAELAGAAVILGSATPAVESAGAGPRRALRPRRPADAGRRASRRRSRSSTCARSSRTGNRGLLSRRLGRCAGGARHGARRPGDPGHQPARDGVGRPVPRLRPRAGLPGLRAAARLPPGRHDAALPSLRAGDAARDALPELPLAADPLPRRRHGARRAGGPRRASRALRVGRLDRDVAERRGAAERIVDAFAAGQRRRPRRDEPGHQGSRHPGVTLVGVVSSDVALNLPDERAAERTYQLLSQAVGRAGRGDRAGRAILQTYQPDHAVIRRGRRGRRGRVLRR